MILDFGLAETGKYTEEEMADVAERASLSYRNRTTAEDIQRECPTCHGSGEDSQHFWEPGTLYTDGAFNATPIPAACTDCEGYGTFQS